MKLLRLKLDAPFRSLPADFEIIFSEVHTLTFSNQPICFVGANGSGKSNVLEAVAEIFEYLDLYFLKYSRRSSSAVDEFLIEYLLSIGSAIQGQFDTLKLEEHEFMHIRITKHLDHAPAFHQIVNGQIEPLLPNPELLPARVVGYSSGQNELLSIPFKKICFKYYNSLRKEHKNPVYRQYIPPPRLNYMDFESHPFILLANYLINPPSTLETFRSRIGIEDIYGFDMNIKTNFRRHDSVQVTSDLERFIDFFRTNATSHKSSSENTFRLSFQISEELKSKFREQFPDAPSLLKVFIQLSLLNLNGIPANRMSRLLGSSANDYINYRPFDYEPDFRLFQIENIQIRKTGIQAPINYRTLSDGEHQFLFIIGLLRLFSTESVLFLFDEPETHFNPLWKYDYVETFKQVINKFKNQILLTTHDPVLLSGLSRENVIIFNRPNSAYDRVYRPDKDLLGMGVDAILTSEIFGMSSTLDQETLDNMIERRKLLVRKESGQLNQDDAARLDALSERLSDIDFHKPFEDPLYKDFILALGDLDAYKRHDLSRSEIEERTALAKQIMERLNQRGR